MVHDVYRCKNLHENLENGIINWACPRYNYSHFRVEVPIAGPEFIEDGPKSAWGIEFSLIFLRNTLKQWWLFGSIEH